MSENEHIKMQNYKKFNWPLCQDKDTNFKVYICCLGTFIDRMPTIKRKNINSVSIRCPTPGYTVNDYKTIDDYNLDNIHVSTFDDVASSVKDCQEPTEKDIYDILLWAKSQWHKNPNHFIVHCTAGVSRSSAVAILISLLLFGEYKSILDRNLHYPNKLILDIGGKILGIDDLKLDVYKLFD